MGFTLEFALSIVLISFVLFSVVDCHQTCPKGQYGLSTNECQPCRSCDKLRIIRQCSQSQDTVCADVLKTRVFHFPCDKGEWGMFVEGKTTLFRNLTKKEREKTKRRTCSDLKKYKKRLVFNRPHRHNNCPNGTYQWVIRTSKEALQVPDCRPCSGCTSGTEVMSPCRGEQDTFCSFPRVKNTMQVFNTQCTEQGPSVHVYSSLPPTVPHTRLMRIGIKLFPRLCSSLSKTMLVQNDHSFLSNGTHANLTSYVNSRSLNATGMHSKSDFAFTQKGSDTSKFDGNVKENQESTRKEAHSKRRRKHKTNTDTQASKGKETKYGRDRKKKRHPKKVKTGEKDNNSDGGYELGENKGTTTDVMHKKSKSGKKHDDMSDKATDDNKRHRGYKNEQPSIDTEQKKSKNEKKDDIWTKHRLCKKKKYKGRRCKHLKKRLKNSRKNGKNPSDKLRLSYNGHDSERPDLADRHPRTTKQPFTGTTAASNLDSGRANVRIPVSPMPPIPPIVNVHYSFSATKSISVLNASSTMRPSTKSQDTEFYHTTNESVEVENSSSSTTYLSVVGTVLGLVFFALIPMVAILLINLRSRNSKKLDHRHTDKSQDFDVQIQPTTLDCSTDTTGSVPIAIRVIKDPLSLKSRSKSQDSGYLTTCSQTSGQGSRTLFREIQTSAFQIESSAYVEDVQLRNAVSTCCVTAKDSHLPTMINNQSSDETRGSSDHAGMHSDTSRRSYSLSEDYRSKNPCDTYLRRQSVSFALPPLCQSDTESQYYSDCEYEGSQDSVFTCQSETGHTCTNPSSAEQGIRDRFERSVDTVSMDSEQTSDADDLGASPPNRPLQTETAPVHFDREHTTCMLAGSASDDTSGRNLPSALLHDDAVASQDSILVSKSRSPSGDSSSSTVSSASLHIKFSLKDEVLNTDWLQKTNSVCPENFLSAYSCSIMTQTDDWSKSNLQARPVFSASWQDQRSFNTNGGTWHLKNSDVILEVPPLAVPYGNYVDITAATFTNLSHLRQVLELADDEVIVGPLPEFDAGPSYQFQQHVRIFLPHCLPLGVPEEHIKLLHIDKDLDGELVIKRLPTKREYDIKQKNTNIASESDQPRFDEEEKDVGYFQFLPNGQLLVATKRFCGFTCTVCSKDLPEPQIHLVATAKKQVRSKRSGEQQQINMRLYLWDRKIAITDFQRDLEGRQVGQQLLHVVDEYDESLMKIAFSIYEDDEEQLWKHAMRPKTTEPIFQPEKIFPLKELLCCHAKDEPKCEEWLIENCTQENTGCHFQCYIDVHNIATSRQSQEAGSGVHGREKKVTLFIHDIGSSPTLDVPKEKDSLEASENGNRPCSCQHRIIQEPYDPVSNTPYGRMEQGPSIRHETTDVPGWLPLSDEPLLHIAPQQVTPASNPDPGVDQFQRTVSCPPSLTNSDNPCARAVEITARKDTLGRTTQQMDIRNGWQKEENENQMQQLEGDRVRLPEFGRPQQNLEELQRRIAPFGAEPRIGEGARPKIFHVNTIPSDKKSRKQNIPRPGFGHIVHRENTANALQETGTKANNTQFPNYVQSIDVHGQSSPRVLNEVACFADGRASRGEWHGGFLLGHGVDGANSPLTPENQPQTALSDSADNINLQYL